MTLTRFTSNRCLHIFDGAPVTDFYRLAIDIDVDIDIDIGIRHGGLC